MRMRPDAPRPYPQEAEALRSMEVASMTPEQRKRACETCGKIFIPRPRQLRLGQGRYCSQKCNKAFHHSSQAPDVWERRISTMREKRAKGEWTIHSGQEMPNWKGGRKATVARRIASGKANEELRRYRAANPHKAREWAQNRRNRKAGKLPYGTIPKLGEMQRWRCAICRTGVREGYHVDHIMPIAKGGKHEPRNIQLLCESCNVRKNSKDPIQYMRELGRLL